MSSIAARRDTGGEVADAFVASAPPTETVTTCVCGHDRAEPISPAYDRLHRLPGKFAHVRCTRCTLVRLSPRPVHGQLGFYYPADYYSFTDPTGTTDDSARTPGRRARLRSFLREAVLTTLDYPLPRPTRVHRPVGRMLAGPLRGSAPYGMGRRFPRRVENGRALDVGCGNGSFLSHLKRHGWQVAGVDVSPRAAEMAKQAFDIDVFVGELWDSPFESRSFDLIQMSHVLEHVSDPARLLAKARDLVKPGGEIYIETPNVESFDCHRAGEYWVPWEAPRHLYLFSPGTLRQLLARTELEIERSSTIRFGHYDWEETYRREGRAGRALPIRPHVRAWRRPYLALLPVAARIAQIRNPLAGEIICCWARRASEEAP